MKLLFVVLAVAVIAGSIYADYRWRKWMAARRQDRQQ
jgi:hypothetical protein